MAVTISLTGRLAIDIGSVPADEAKLGRLGRLAVAYLAVERHRPVPRDELADVLWGEDLPATWDSALRGVISRVRAVLSAAGLEQGDVVRGEFGCYQLALPPELDVVVDVEAAAAAIDVAERDVREFPENARIAAAQAEAVAARQFLPGSGGAWVERRQAELAALRVRALELLAETSTACGDHTRAVAAAEQAVDLAPLQESAHQRLMEAHARSGNRGAALRAYERCRRLLSEELGVSPSPATEAAYLRILADEPTTPGALRTNLSAATTSFVGRQGQIAELRTLLGLTRLLTLTGPGGVGKSRLAVEVAGGLLGDYPDGVWLVELAGLGDPALVPQELLAVLGVPEATGSSPIETLAQYLANRRVLLLLDNCEHLVEACASVADALLRTCRGLSVLATSREPLGVAGEMTWAVAPLSTPPAGDEALRLFGDRAVAAVPGLDVRAAAEEVALVCSRLDGMPLAIELAAARARAMSIPDIARRLDDRLRLLVGGPRTAPPRHQTMRAALDWSYEALSRAERRVFARLSVFAGGFTLEAAERVCGGDGIDGLPALTALVDKSLVLADHTGRSVRYRVLETLRQYGAEQLVAEHEQDVVRDRHLAWATALAGQAEPALEGAEQTRWLALLDAENDNARAALDWAAASGQAELGLALASSLLRFWEIRGHLSEGRSRLDAWASRPDGPPALRAKALNAAAVLAQRQRDLPAARTYYQESLVTRRALGDQLGAAVALHGLGNLAVADDDLVTARSLFEENLAIGRTLGQHRMVAASLMNLGVVAHYSFMHNWVPVEQGGPEARDYYEQSLACYRELGDRYGVALALENLGALGPRIGDYEVSLARHQESMAIRRELGDKMGIATSARFLAARAIGSGELATARQLSEERLAIERELGNLRDVAESLESLGEIAAGEGELDEARALLEESLIVHRDIDDPPARCRVLAALSDVARRLGDLGRARTTLEASWQLACEANNEGRLAHLTVLRAKLARAANNPRAAVLGCRDAIERADRTGWIDLEAMALEVLAGVAVDERELPRAARLLGAARRIRQPPGRPPIPRPADNEHDRDIDAARRGLGEEIFRSALREGEEMSDDVRRAYARGVGAENE